MMWGWSNWSWQAWLAMTSMMTVLLVLVVLVLVPFTRRSGEEPRSEGILAERFARGDIDEEEYRRRREVIQRSR